MLVVRAMYTYYIKSAVYSAPMPEEALGAPQLCRVSWETSDVEIVSLILSALGGSDVFLLE